MNSSLERLVGNLPGEALKYTREGFGERSMLMKRKGVYPYDFMDSFDKFKERLPSKDEFYSVLNDEHISGEDYEHAKSICSSFQIESDVLPFAAVFENFRKTCLEHYKLDPCLYFTSPGLPWDAMLKMTKTRLELMNDVDMFQFIEKGMRGGTSYIVNRHGVANNTKYERLCFRVSNEVYHVSRCE